MQDILNRCSGAWESKDSFLALLVWISSVEVQFMDIQNQIKDIQFSGEFSHILFTYTLRGIIVKLLTICYTIQVFVCPSVSLSFPISALSNVFMNFCKLSALTSGLPGLGSYQLNIWITKWQYLIKCCIYIDCNLDLKMGFYFTKFQQI